tara:strand:- start:381 stop:548 length:168 start_codon:yes stop_codon:yes gene_type:complete
MAKDIQMIKGQDKISVNENNLAHFESLGYKVVGKQEIVKPKVIEKQKDNKEKTWR